MKKEPIKIMQQQPGEFIPPLASELDKTLHSISSGTQIKTQPPKNQSLELHQCQSIETNKQTQSLLCSETYCESVTHQEQEAALLETVPSAEEVEVTKVLCEKPADLPLPVQEEKSEEDNGRERLKRHRIDVAGRVWIPDMWGQEEMLKDWIDCSAFDASLVPSGIMSARAALAQEGRRAHSGGLRVENRC